MKNKRDILITLLCFFLSGVAGLIYEIAWIRKASLIFGTTNYAMSTVIAVFFGGLAAGSFYFGKIAQRSEWPLKIYGKIEIVAGIIALFSIGTFAIIEMIYSSYYDMLLGNSILLLIIRGLLIFTIIFPTTFLLGGTLPLFVKKFAKSSKGVLKSVGMLYAINTLGGVVGILLAGLFLIPKIGVNISIIFGGLLNILSGVFVLSRYKKIIVADTDDDIVENNVTGIGNESKVNQYFFPLAVFFSGFSFLGIEILWSRFLSLVIYNTVYTYTITLSVILFGMVTGSFIIYKFNKKFKADSMIYGITLLISGLFILLTFKLPSSLWIGIAGNASLFKQFFLVSLIMFIPSILSGMIFPLSVKIFSQKRNEFGKSTGFVTAINTFGGILGSVITGFIFIPYLGIERSLYILSGAFLICGIVLTLFNSKKKLILAIVSVLLIVLSAILVPVILKVNIPNDYLGKKEQIIDVVEGISSNISVLDKGGLKVLEINRLWQGENRITRQIMAAHIPMLLHSNPKKIALVGLGAGQTGERFLMYDIDSLFCVDIEKELFGLVKKHFNVNWLDNEKVRLIVDDGNSYLTNTKSNFDLISLEVGQTFRPYLASFYTQDFYKKISKKLLPGGMVSQFIPLGSFDQEMFKSVIKSFITVFPNSVLWYNTDELLLIGSIGAQHPMLNYDRLELLQNNKDIYYDLKFKYWGGPRHVLNDWQVFAGGFLCGPETLERISKDSKIYRNDPPTLEYEAASVGEVENYIDYIIAICDDPSKTFPNTLSDSISNAIEFIRTTNLRNILAERLHIYFLKMKNPKLLDKALELNPQNTIIIDELARFYFRRGNKDAALKYIKHSLDVNHFNVDMQNTAGTIYYLQKNYKRAVFHFREALKVNPKVPKIHKNLAMAHLGVGDLDYAGFHAEAALKLEPNNKEIQRLYRQLLSMKKARDDSTKTQIPFKN